MLKLASTMNGSAIDASKRSDHAWGGSDESWSDPSSSLCASSMGAGSAPKSPVRDMVACMGMAVCVISKGSYANGTYSLWSWNEICLTYTLVRFMKTTKIYISSKVYLPRDCCLSLYSRRPNCSASDSRSCLCGLFCSELLFDSIWVQPWASSTFLIMVL